MILHVGSVTFKSLPNANVRKLSTTVVQPELLMDAEGSDKINYLLFLVRFPFQLSEHLTKSILDFLISVFKF